MLNCGLQSISFSALVCEHQYRQRDLSDIARTWPKTLPDSALAA